MLRSRISRQLLGSTILIGAAAMASPAFAQDTDPADDTIIVTGTRLKANPNLESANPVLSLGAEEIQARGIVSIEDLTNSLPQAFANQGAEVSNGATGTSTLNLRGLGAVRTLVLIDGRRLPYGSSQTSPANLDLVPTQLVERVEVLTGGASAVYGSDAVGGVANFILKDDFEGLAVDSQYGFMQTANDEGIFGDVLRAGNVPVPGSVTDGDLMSFAVTLGANSGDGRGNITVFASYDDREAITQDNRVYSGCALGPSTGPNSANGYGCVGSANFRLFGGPGGFVFQQEDGELTPFAGGPAETFNFGPFNFFQRPVERWNIYSRAHYEFADGHEVFGDLSYYNAISDAQIAPSASFGFGAYQINCDNPLIQGNDGVAFTEVFGCSDQDIIDGTIVSGITASHRNVEGGPRNSRLSNSALRMIGGLRGEFGEGWSYEQFFQYSQTRDEQIGTNDFIVDNLQQALFATTDDQGNVVCVDQSGGCVPYNIFQRGPGGESLVTQDSLDFLQGVGIVVGNTNQVVVGGSLQSNLDRYGIQSPFSDSGVGFLAGYEYRRDELDSQPDEIFQVPGGGFTGLGGATLPVSGAVNVFELFTEVQVPLVTDKPLMEELVLSGQYRWSDYSASGNQTTNEFSTDAYGVSLAYSPTTDLTLRAQFQRAVRAPNVIELYTGQDVGLPNLNADPASGLFDPCATATPAASLEVCQRTGVTAAQYGSIVDVISGQTQGITGGNPDLQPEVADTITIGAVFEPSFIDGLTASIDWFEITVEDAISAGIGAQTILDNCLATGDETFCSLVTRDASGSLNSGTPGVGFLLTNINIANLETSGIDFQLGYDLDLDRFGGSGLGDVNFNYAATLLDSFSFTPFPGGDAIECSGKFSNECPQPVNSKYRHRLLATWSTPVGLDVTSTWRHFSGTDNLSGATGPVDARLDTVNYWDLSANYAINETVRIRGGINNLLDVQPPVFSSAGPPEGNGNTYPVTFDIGRFIFAGINVQL